MKRLIMNADDFGCHEGVVRGIVDLHQAGVVTSTSCMTNMPAWPQAATYLREHPELGAGVHLVFNAGMPVLPKEEVRTLIGNDGRFCDNRQIIWSVRMGTTAQLRAEFRAQIGRFTADVGRPPDHLDNHSGISYVRPDRFKVTLELAKEYDLPIRFPFGDDLHERAVEMGRVWGYPTWSIRWLGSRYRHRVDSAGIQRPNAFLQGFSPGGPRTVDHLLSVLETARDGWVSEFLTHPGYDGDWREEELRVLQDPRVRMRLKEPDIELVRFADV
jgi:predicted glycoside hydrolase/deacetylase ChbG (UPF0249 family)